MGNNIKAVAPVLDYLTATHTAVKSVLGAAQTLPEFRAISDSLNRDEKMLIVKQALILLRENYVHLPLKQNMHAVRPIQALNILRQVLESKSDDFSDIEFHRTMLRIFDSVRDLHTRYILPSPYNSMATFLPFLLESYVENGQRRYLVSHIVGGYENPSFERGVQITSWNGVPIDLAVEASSLHSAGSNKAAQQARGLERMTIRPLVQSLPPDEDFVLVGFRTNDGEKHEIRHQWLAFTPDGIGGSLASTNANSLDSLALGVDMEAQMTGVAKKFLFAPSVVAEEAAIAENGRAKNGPATIARAPGNNIQSNIPGTLEARIVETTSGDFGYIRIRNFNVSDADAFVKEFIRLIGFLPKSGLIIDVRNNMGGLIHAAELLLQILTPQYIQPERAQFINSTTNLELVKKNSPSSTRPGLDLVDWKESMEESIGTGAKYSRGYPITDIDWANSIGQKYQGPTLLVTDAKCYSATDIFAAGFQDHSIGIIVGVDDNTGAGGANVWSHSLLKSLSGKDGPYETLPSGADMLVAMRRTVRVGARSGMPVEDLGVKPDIQYDMTRVDQLESNQDLIEFSAWILSQYPVRYLHTSMTFPQAKEAVLSIETKNLDRVDIIVSDRPIRTLDVGDGNTVVKIIGDHDLGSLRLEGFFDQKLVVSWQ